MEVGQHLPATHLSEAGIQKLICNSLSVLVEASVHDHSFWNAIKQHVQLKQLLISSLLDQTCQGVRKEIAETIIVACSPSQPLKDSGKSSDDGPQMRIALPEDPLKMDILSTVWDAFVQALPHATAYPYQSREFFEVALLVFHSIAEKSPHDLKFGEYLSQWSGIMLSHRTDEVCPYLEILMIVS
jgi:ubiquitin carboxyl-terminal hydrolase 34